MKTSFGSHVRKKRRSLGYSQEQLSDKTGLSLRTIQRIENEENKPRGHSLRVISDVLDIPLGKEVSYKQNNYDFEVKTKLSLINSSALIGIIVPYSALFFPLILWFKNRSNYEVDLHARGIVNFQITWVLATSLLLAIAPFVQLLFINSEDATTYRPILIVYCTAVILNTLFVLRASKRISAGNYSNLYPEILKIL